MRKLTPHPARRVLLHVVRGTTKGVCRVNSETPLLIILDLLDSDEVAFRKRSAGHRMVIAILGLPGFVSLPLSSLWSSSAPIQRARSRGVAVSWRPCEGVVVTGYWSFSYELDDSL
jgi:hypothetical protein